ncbi:MAG TPA: hypothetical protein VIM40_03720 [Arthrobacter sp.]
MAHRLSTVQEADLILVMDHGQIAEQGTRRSLPAANARYGQLHQAQSAARAGTLEAAR